MKICSLLAAALLAGATAAAAPIDRDLGQGLAYRRVHSLPAELPDPKAGARHAWVLDVRYVAGGPAAGAALLGWLKAAAGPHAPVFLLANAATSGAVLAPLNSPDAVVGLVILGPGTPDFLPDLSLTTPAAAERRAYDALEKGAPIESLLVENPDKPRNDEARLARDHVSDSSAADEEPVRAPDAGRKPPPPIDASLQRAVQLHRALLALKRL